jgi:hypothetical protein
LHRCESRGNPPVRGSCPAFNQQIFSLIFKVRDHYALQLAAELWFSAVRQNSTNKATRDQDRPWDLISHWSLKYSDSLSEAHQQPPDGAAFAITTE